MFPIMFIIVNQDAKTQVQIILRLQHAIASVVDPTRYKGNTNCISGYGDVNVKIHEPATVTITENISK